jgi:signal peptidase I
MEPAIGVGALVATAPEGPENLKVGEVISFWGEGGALVCHRVVEIRDQAFITKGDANEGNDSSLVPFDEVEGRVAFSVPLLGYVISFLKTTLHGRLPLLVMIPWFICGIAILVELNFRGFLLGRLASLESGLWGSGLAHRLTSLAVITCALIFAFDPFMVNTFQHLHWIALWDGLIWGIIYLRTRNLYITIVAHAVEVIVMYSAVRFALSN